MQTSAAYGDLLDHLRKAPRIGFDTEFVPERTFRPVLCLIQVATDKLIAGVDALAIDDLSEFWDALIRPGIEVIVHASRAELEFCLASKGTVPASLFDTQLAAGIAGLGHPLSYTKLVKTIVGADLPSGQTRTDWERRPLSEAQIAYAMEDVRHLLQLQDKIGGRLDRLGRRRWYEEEIARLEDAVRIGMDESLAWMKTSGSGTLSAEDLAILRELVGWRTQRARHLDRPARQIMRDDQLIDLSKRKPKGPEDIAGVRGLGQLGQARWADDVFAAIERGINVPSAERPHRERKSNARTSDAVHKLLGATLKQVATDHHIATSLLGTSDDLRELLNWHAHGRANENKPRLARGWRAKIVGNTLMDVLDGKLMLGVIDAGKHGLELIFVDE